MLLQAAEKYNIDVSLSYMIGDHERDIQAGKAAGCITVGVGTGKGFKKTITKSDYFFSDLKEAVNFIITEPHKNTAQIVCETIQKSEKIPFIIAVGGNSQSGKTTFAAYLKQYLIQQKMRVLKIDLDDWILPKQDRKSTHDVMHNFQQDKLTSDLKRILKGGMIELEGYTKIHGNKPVPASYLLKAENVIIIEGVIGLALPYLQEIADLKIFKSIDESLHKERIMKYFKWKGYTEAESEERYNQRKTGEYDMNTATSKTADLII
jgi:uridine kinase